LLPLPSLARSSILQTLLQAIRSAKPEMDRTLPLLYGHYVVPMQQSVFAGFPCQPVTVPTRPDEYVYFRGRTPSRICGGRPVGGPSTWNGGSVFDHRKAAQAPFDMDSLKAAIQVARPDCGEVRKAIESSTFKPRERAFTRLINMCGRQKESRKALEVFETMLDYRGVRPNTYTYSALISACSSAGDWDLAVDVFHRMKTAATSDPRCRPNQVTFNAIISASERGGHYDVCLACFQDMMNTEYSPDSVTYCSAINACQKLGRWEEAERILSVMHSHRFVASLGIYSTMIDHYATHSSWEAALDLFLTMQMLGQSVDARCCHGLMLALEAGQQPDMAFQLIEAMWDNDICIETSMYVTALRIMAPAAMWEQVLQVITKLHERGSTVPLEAVSLLISSMKSAGRADLALRIESVVEQSGVDLQPNEASPRETFRSGE